MILVVLLRVFYLVPVVSLNLNFVGLVELFRGFVLWIGTLID